MKAMTLIPKKIKQKYNIHKHKNSISVHNPAFVNIDFDERFKIVNGKITLDIENSKCVVNLWKKVKYMSITIYK
jgi:hypothetical protein